MTNAKKIVVSNKEDNIKSIKSINFNNVTPITEEQKLDTEIKKDPRFTNDLVDQIRGSEAEISGLKATNSDNTKLVNELKIDQYVGLITHIAPLKLSASGNLTKADTRAISEDLVNECSMSKANAKLLKDNSVKFVVKFDVPSQATPEMIRDIMTDNGITSQTKLKQAVNPQDDILLGDKIARMIYGKMKSVKNTEGIAEDKFVQTDLTADDIKIIEETLADAKRMWEAVEKANKESAKDQSEDNQQVKDTFKALGI
jgi:hypothetical protein|tara:strand:- start:1162 stop:1932 length:771 start_codon:yes stop_codon:yes gene_type:complete